MARFIRRVVYADTSPARVCSAAPVSPRNPPLPITINIKPVHAYFLIVCDEDLPDGGLGRSFGHEEACVATVRSRLQGGEATAEKEPTIEDVADVVALLRVGHVRRPALVPLFKDVVGNDAVGVGLYSAAVRQAMSGEKRTRGAARAYPSIQE